MGKKYKDDEEQMPRKVTDIDAAKENINAAVYAFNERWAAMPGFAIGVEVMDQRQLRDAMGLRATIDTGDPWPAAERLLLELGFRWHWLGGMRVMYVQERDSFVQAEGFYTEVTEETEGTEDEPDADAPGVVDTGGGKTAGHR